MSTEQLRQEIMALPLSERIEVAQTLWQDIHEEMSSAAEDEEREAVVEAHRRDKDLASGSISGRSHKQIMEAARQALQCG